VLCIGWAVGGAVTARADGAAVAAALSAAVAEVPANTTVGLVVEELGSGKPWFAQNADLPLKPASVLKLFVTAAGLERFGLDFRWRTTAYWNGGEFWVCGAGDPGLGDERIARRDGRTPNHVFEGWARELRARGITRVEKLVIDDSIFDQQWRHRDWPIDQSSAWYQAPVGGVNVNDNCVDVRAYVQGGGLRIESQPLLPAALLRNELMLTSSKRNNPVNSRKHDSDVFYVRGAIAKNTVFGPVSAREPTVFFAYALRQTLLEAGIDVGPGVVRRTLRADELGRAERLSSHETSLRDVVWRCNTFSQNLFAECLLKSLAAYRPDGGRTGVPGGWESGQEVLRATLGRMGIDLAGATLRDGSGLSHGNRVTAAQVVRVLQVMQRHRFGEEFRESLAVAGEEGTLRRKLSKETLRGRVQAKTGTISGVRALAGYVTRPDGTELAFALLVNGPGGSQLPAKVTRILVETE